MYVRTRRQHIPLPARMPLPLKFGKHQSYRPRPGRTLSPKTPPFKAQHLFLPPVRITLSVMPTEPGASVAAILGAHVPAGMTVGTALLKPLPSLTKTAAAREVFVSVTPADPNGCGTCTGTMPGTCSGADTVCPPGTIFNDSCGDPTCTGTKPTSCSSACFYGCSSTSCTGGTCYCPTTVPTPLVPPPPTCTNTVFPRTYSWTGNTNATGYQFQLYKGTPSAPLIWCKNISLGSSTTSYNLTSCDNPGVDTTGSITWGVAAHYSHNSCADSAYATKTYELDKTASTVPSGLTATCDMFGVVSASWNPSTDTGCADSVSYWAQVSKDPTFATAYSDSSWLNSWTLPTSKSTNNGAFAGGDTVYLHVRSRDGLDNQSAWSANFSVLCPIPTGTIQARAVQVDPRNTSCATIRAGGTGGIPGTWFQFTPSSPEHPPDRPAQIQSGSSYVVFSDLLAATLGLQYGIMSSPPPGYVLARTCWADASASTTGETSYATLYTLHTLTWDVGFTRGTPWAQAQGGDVYASATLQSDVPVSPPLPPPRAFILDGTTGGYPGIATYGQDYNFDSSWLTHGETWVSSKKWLVNDTASG